MIGGGTTEAGALSLTLAVDRGSPPRARGTGEPKGGFRVSPTRLSIERGTFTRSFPSRMTPRLRFRANDRALVAGTEHDAVRRRVLPKRKRTEELAAADMLSRGRSEACGRMCGGKEGAVTEDHRRRSVLLGTQHVLTVQTVFKIRIDVFSRLVVHTLGSHDNRRGQKGILLNVKHPSGRALPGALPLFSGFAPWTRPVACSVHTMATSIGSLRRP